MLYYVMARLPTMRCDRTQHLYLMRHGETTWNRDNRIQGHCNPRLSVAGHRQVRQTARHMRGRGIQRIFTSDLQRATVSAAIVQRALRVPMTVTPALREIYLGTWEGLTPDQVNRRHHNGYARWLAAPASVRIPRAETRAMFRRRVVQCWNHGLLGHHEDRVLVVTHGGVITALLAHLLHAHFDTMLIGLLIDNASLTHVIIRGRHISVAMINRTWH